MKPLIWAVAFFLLAVSGYSSQRSPANVPTVTYFPPQTFEVFVVNWYSKHLSALQEPSLWEMSKSSKQQIYRFLWLRTFDAPIAIRLSINTDGTGILTTKISNGKGGYDAGRLSKNTSKKISKDDTQWFLGQLDEQEYWDLPFGPKKYPPDEAHLDGAEWVMEAITDGNYKIVAHWSPTNGPIRVLGINMLINLAKLRLLFEDVY